jgi:hypothetical protein
MAIRLSTTEEQEFANKYAKLTAAVWANDELRAQLYKSPSRTLAQFGLFTRSDAKINVIPISQDVKGMGSIEGQAQRWAAGNETGVYDILVLEKPAEFKANVAIPARQLAEMGLDELAIDISCCCCTPCCCCT